MNIPASNPRPTLMDFVSQRLGTTHWVVSDRGLTKSLREAGHVVAVSGACYKKLRGEHEALVLVEAARAALAYEIQFGGDLLAALTRLREAGGYRR